MMNTTVIDKKTNPTDLNDTNFWSYMLYSLTLWLYAYCYDTFWYTSFILSTKSFINLLYYCFGRDAKSESFIRHILLIDLGRNWMCRFQVLLLDLLHRKSINLSLKHNCLFFLLPPVFDLQQEEFHHDDLVIFKKPSEWHRF